MELMQASHQWATRPDDERFTSLLDLESHCRSVRERSVAKVLSNKRLLAAPVAEDETGRGLCVVERQSGAPALPSHWSFQQLAARVGAPAGYLRELPAAMAADCLNYGLQHTRDVEELGCLLRAPDGAGVAELTAVTGPNYGRVWNAEIAKSLVKAFGDGVNGDFRVPGEWGERVEVTKANTTLFAGDRDMFVFLCDEENRIELASRRELANGTSLTGSLARGFFVWNSEVGSGTLGIAAFLFDYVCGNRIVWGARDFKEIRIRHTSGAPDRWIQQVKPALERYSHGATANVVTAIEDARNAKIAPGLDAKARQEKVDAFLNTRFTRSQTGAIKLAHEAEEGRPIESYWDAVTGATAYARSIQWQDERVAIERKAGDILTMVSGATRAAA